MTLWDKLKQNIPDNKQKVAEIKKIANFKSEFMSKELIEAFIKTGENMQVSHNDCIDELYKLESNYLIAKKRDA